MKTAALSPLVAAALLAAPALADPALPPGWIVPKKPAAPVDPPAENARAKERPAVIARAIDVDTLPVVAIAKARPQGEIPARMPPGSAADLVVLSGSGPRRLNVKGFTVGMLFVGPTEAWTGVGGAGGIAGVCGSDAKGLPIKPIRYEAIRRADDRGAIEFVTGRGFIEKSTCKISIEERLSVQPARLGTGRILGFRTRCDGCAEGARDALHVVTPQLGGTFDRLVPFEHRALTLEPGASRIVEGFVSSSQLISFRLPRWSDFSDMGCKNKKEDSCSGPVRIEVSRAAAEAKATVIVRPAVEE
jgi:hypothetical protein